MSKFRLAAVAVALLLSAGAAEPPTSRTTPRVKILETGPLHLDRIYTSMAGPFDRASVDVSDMAWVTAYSTHVVAAESRERVGDEFFCHSQLQIPNTTRLMVTATGSEEIRFPEGFGMPVLQIVGGLPPDEREVTFLGMALNNHRPAIDEQVRIRATVEYYTREDLGFPPKLKKLYKVGLPMTVEDLEAYVPDPATPPQGDAASHCVLVEGLESHWMVPPGRQITRRRFSGIVPVDATAHYAVVHLHNHGVSLRLTDVTEGKMLWKTEVEYEPDRVQIVKIPVYSSVEGFAIYADHEYEIEALYRNDTDHDIDAMALIDLYYHPLRDENITYAAP